MDSPCGLSHKWTRGHQLVWIFGEVLSGTVVNFRSHPPVTSPTQEDTTTNAPEPSAESTRPGGFLADTVQELKLVVWPSRQQLFSESIAVILMVSLSAATIAAVSRFFGWASSQVFR